MKCDDQTSTNNRHEHHSSLSRKRWRRLITLTVAQPASH